MPRYEVKLKPMSHDSEGRRQARRAPTGGESPRPERTARIAIMTNISAELFPRSIGWMKELVARKKPKRMVDARST